MAQGATDDLPRTGVLIKEDIRQLGIIEFPDGDEGPEDARCFKPASYDLRLGHEYIVPGPRETGLPRILDCRETEGRVDIPPFASVIVCTYEIVRLPPNVVGKFNLRIKQAFRGLIVQMGTQVEPNYHGRLFALLQNITDQPITILYKDYGTRPFTIEFCHTTADSGAESKRLMALRDFVQDVQVSSTLDRILHRAHAAEEASQTLLGNRISAAEKNQLTLKDQLEGEIKAAGPRWLTVYGILLSFAVAAIITVAAPMMLKLVFDLWPYGGLKALTISEAAKTLSESVRDENERLKERVKEMQAKTAASEESLKNVLKRISDLEQKAAATPAAPVSAQPGGFDRPK